MRSLAPVAIQSNLASIESTLNAAGAHRWTPEAIEAHKARELAKAPPASALWPYSHVLSKINRSVLIYSDLGMFVSTFLAFLAFFGGTIVGILSMLRDGHFFNSGTMFLGLVVLALLGCGAVALVIYEASHLISLIKMRGPAEWKVYVYDRYFFFSVPSLAHRIIESSLMLRPDSTIRVHRLMQDECELDPILEIDGNCVLVWDKDGNIILPQV